MELVCALQDVHVIVDHLFLADCTQWHACWTARPPWKCVRKLCRVHRDGHLLCEELHCLDSAVPSLQLNLDVDGLLTLHGLLGLLNRFSHRCLPVWVVCLFALTPGSLAVSYVVTQSQLLASL